MLRVTPIYGSRHDNNPNDKHGAASTPSCTLVEYGGCRVLINVGWDDSMASKSLLLLPEHDVLVITDSTLGAMGGLPLYHTQFPSIPIYATFPTVKMGQMTLYDHHASLSLDGTTPPYTLDDIDTCCAALHTIKYSQHILVPYNQHPPNLRITAQRAGHVVGGAFYIIQRLQDETSIVVTSTYNIGKELHLDSSTLVKYGVTPDVLITRPGGPAMTFLSRLYGSNTKSKPLLPTPVVSQAERTLVETVLAVLRREGNVLLPVDASGRVLEVLLLLSQQWDRQRLAGAYNLCWVGPMTQNTIDFCRSQLEWMAAPLGAQFDSQRGHPFQLNNVSICSSMSELESVLGNGNPSCVLATGASLDHGFARDLLLKFADNPDHAIVFTDSSRCVLRGVVPTDKTAVESVEPSLATTEEEGEASLIGSAIPPDQSISEYSTAAQLLMHWGRAKLEGEEMEDVVEVDILLPHRSPLAGPELKAFLAQEEAARQAQKAAEERRALLREVEIAKGQLRLGEEETTGGGTDAGGSGAGVPRTQPKLMNTRPKKKSRFDSSLFLKFSKPLHLTFEVREEAVGIGQPDSVAKGGVGESVGRSGEVLEDDYGIAVLPERFVDIVTGVDPSKFAGGTGRIGEEVMRRGLGFGADGRPVVSKGGSSTKAEGQPGAKEATGGEEEVVLNEQALEAEDLSEGKGIIRGRNGRPPIKVSTVPRRLEVLAEISYVPLEGRVSSSVARQTVRALQPRQLVVLGSSDTDDSSNAVDEVKLLVEAARSYIVGSRVVVAPSDGETAELNVGHAAFSARLIDTPYLTAEEREARGEDAEPLAPIEPFEAQLGECTVSLFDGTATGRKVALDGSLVLAPRAVSGKMAQRPIYISNGDVLLTDLRSELIAQGMKADYSTRVGFAQLVVNGKVIVKKEQDSGKINVEGPLCEDFFTVQAVVRGQYATL